MSQNVILIERGRKSTNFISPMCFLLFYHYYITFTLIIITFNRELKVIFWHRFIDLVGRMFANGPEEWVSIPGRVIVMTQKMLHDASLLNTQVSRVKWINLGKRLTPSPTPWCSSYWKGRFRFTLNYSHQIFFKLTNIWLVPLFNGISTFVGYIMPKSSF